jgi:hypothetical protein
MSVFSFYDKKAHYNRAKELLASNDINKSKYACLELRYFIEAMVYQKLVKCGADIPEAILNTWQPNKAIKMLNELDSLTTGSFKIEVNLSNSSELPKEGWLSLGEQKIPDVKRINKLYNKLGGFLHLTEPRRYDEKIENNILKQSNDILDELSEYVDGNIVASFGKYKYSSCPVCKYDFFFSKKMKHGDIINCKSQSCKASFIVNIKPETNEIKFQFRTYDVSCQSCDNEMVIPEKSIHSLEPAVCGECGAVHIVKCSYGYALQPQAES